MALGLASTIGFTGYRFATALTGANAGVAYYVVSGPGRIGSGELVIDAMPSGATEVVIRGGGADTQFSLRGIGSVGERSVLLAALASGQSDAQQRAAIGGAATIGDGVGAAGLLRGSVVVPPTPTPTPTPAPSLSLSSAVTQAEGNSGTTAFAYTLTLNRDGSTAAYPYTWAVAGSGANPADAADFGGTFPTGSGTFAPGETIKTITVLATGDTAVEPDDTFTLTVAAAGLNTVTATGTITDDDAAVLARLPTVASAPMGAVALGGVVPGFTGSTASACAIGDTSTSPTAVAAITQKSDGSPDFTAAIASFGASFAIWKLVDQVTGADCIQTDSTQRGIVTATTAGEYTWTNLTTGLVDSLNNYPWPTSLITDRRNLTQVVIAGGNNSTTNINSLNAGGLALQTVGQTDVSSAAQFTTGDGGIGSRTSVGAYSSLPMTADMTFMAVRYNATNTKYFRNDDSATATAPAAVTGMVGGLIGGVLFSTFKHSDGTRHFAHVVYPALSDADVATLKGWAYQRAAIVPKTAHIILDGDSIQRGVGSTAGRNKAWYLRGTLLGNPYLENVGIGGQQATVLVTQHGATWFAGMFRPGYTKNIYVGEQASNDIFGGVRTLAEIQSAVQTTITNARNAGFTVIWELVIARAGTGFPAQEQKRLDYNQWLRDNYVSLGLAAVIDYAPVQTQISYADSSQPGVVGVVGVHPDSAGYAVMAPVARDVINAVLAT